MTVSQVSALASRPLPPLSRILVAAALLVSTWEMRALTRKQLCTMEPHRLQDIGLDRTSAERESAKPFWR